MPLVNVYYGILVFLMENSLKMALFHSYVKLPEGNHTITFHNLRIEFEPLTIIMSKKNVHSILKHQPYLPLKKRKNMETNMLRLVCI